MMMSLRPIALTALLSGSQIVLAAPAIGYPMDCAILLCLAGGWPTSAVCSAAKAVFIRRITPWPVEAPLQIWNCPLNGTLEGAPGGDRSDIDISGPTFDFVRSVRVFQIDHRQYMNGDRDCLHSGTIRRGDYGSQGEFRWTNVYPGDVPPASRLPRPQSCETFSYRAVFLEWRSDANGYDFQEIRY